MVINCKYITLERINIIPVAVFVVCSKASKVIQQSQIHLIRLSNLVENSGLVIVMLVKQQLQWIEYESDINFKYGNFTHVSNNHS